MSILKNPMLRSIVTICLGAALLIPTTGAIAAQPSRPGRGGSPTHLADELITYVDSPGIGEIAVQVRVPETPRYPEGAGVVVEASTFWVNPHGFYVSADVTELGLIHIAYLWPGQEDPSGAKSGGTFDYGGEESIRALRDIIRFASGQIPNRDGLYLEDLIAITPLNDAIGLYAFSHPGIAAVNALALHGDQLSVGYFVGRENPTLDVLSAVEVGHWDETGPPVFNPLYSYPQGYTPTRLVIDYSSVRWDPDYEDEHIPYVGRPYFDLNSNEQRDETDYLLGHRGSVMFDKRNYSIPLTRALRDNGAIDEADWPSDLATPEEAEAIWSFRSSVHRYPDLTTKTPDLKVMLVFARHDHVQPARDKPHIHQAYDGFHHTAGLWTRLNPDKAYIAALNSELGGVSPEHPANAEPNDWLEIEAWGHTNGQPGTTLAPLAAVAEMADRVRENNWGGNLDEVLVEYPPPNRVYLPLLMKDWFGEPTVITDVTFAVVEGESLALDAYLPAEPGLHPAVILIHGGYWQAGDKESHSRLGEWMAEHDYAAFAINYRLAPEFPFPAAVADVQCAVAWVREHAAEYDVDADRIALMGTSAGGHLAALAGLAAVPASPEASWQPSCGDPTANVEVQAVISCFGPVDLAFHAQESEPAEGIVAVFLGGQACQDAPQLCAAASPMTYVTADAPPTLLIHGADDDVVSCENSARLYAALDGVGADVTYLPIEGAQHGFIVGIRTSEAQAAMEAVGDFLAAAF